MAESGGRLKLGKGAAFVKSRLKYLAQEEDTWEADFFPIPCSDGPHGMVWMGMVLSHAHDYVLAQRMFRELPDVNDLARLLADAMQRPLAGSMHRPRCIRLRARPEWAELLPHLKQIGIEAVPQETLPRWDRAFGDLQAQVKQALAARGAGGAKGPDQDVPARRGKPMTKSGKPSQEPAKGQGQVRVYTLDVFLPRKRFSKSFLKNKSGVSRLIEVRGDQTLEDLHRAIFAAFDREEEHLYEFQLGQGPGDRRGPIYDDRQAVKTAIDSLGLGVGRRFGYLFDFGDHWQHQINVEAVAEKVPEGAYPRVTRKAGKSPPQYPDEDK